MDTIANFLTSLRNAELAGHSSVTVPTTKVVKAIAAILKETGYVGQISEDEKTLSIGIRKGQLVHTYRRISKPGRRLYVGSSEIPTIRNGNGIAIISTSKGLLTGQQAKKEGLGGELICEVY